MIGRVRGRKVFAELSRDGRRFRHGAVTVRFLPRDGGGPHVAFAVGRPVGIAVVRNRVRRRLRAIVSMLGRTQPSLLHHGYYLVAVTPAAANMSYQALANDVTGALAGLDDLEGSAAQ